MNASKKGNTSTCKLCHEEKILCDSHIIPAFVFKWLKKTSATGFIRRIEEINKRVEDGKKVKLLCNDCEGIFSISETEFSKNIFYPYVDNELNNQGIAQGIIKELVYDSWLLKFIISIQWRLIIAGTSKNLPFVIQKRIDEFKENAREYLLNKREDTGENESHLFFLQNLASGNGNLPKELNAHTNHYILRAIDGTPFYNSKSVGIYCKLGPIALVTSLLPSKLKDSIDTKINLMGSIKTAQNLKNIKINDFIFVIRPNEVYETNKLSENQNKKINESYKKNPHKAINSMTLFAVIGDEILKNKLKENEI